MKMLPLAFQSGKTFLAELDPDHYITDKKRVVAKLTAENLWVKPIVPIVPADFVSIANAEYERLTAPYRAMQEYEKTGVVKHMQGQHDQSTHGGKKSYDSVESLAKNGLDIQSAVDELGGNSVENGNVGMRVLLERTGKGGKPEVVASIEDLDGEPIYRGTLSESAEGMKNNEFDRIGVGQYGDGYYFSNRLETASQYAQYEDAENAVITAGWKKDAKVFAVSGGNMGWIDASVASQNAAIEKLNVNTRANDNEDATYNLFFADYGNAFATDLILQGFDGMTLDINENEKYTVVFNREALQVVGN
jgi:hypothetical protein